ncbi:DUF192 domain-containing protein [Methanococcoides burtonii]|uniref:DUF192 domain-containing protein n=1 Tax=Methanococcoides burtonii (strain DSM 6242 / NBRC 107633 / OCM 468 / ACE-M) TaxID=259564 RepID=Q12UF0_METBU|nr:DUF192 domain-containing protein [Methanococcoides burtonii]ABE52926.1 Protein of unknown function DUF192 [Methanococcoides burtonii DSM 6242]
MLLKSNGDVISSDVDYAKSMFQQAKGLMFRRSVHDSYAMVFIFSSLRKISLHMLFVPFPIDVLFLNEDKIIVKTTHLRPWIGIADSGEKIRYVIELPSGAISSNGLKVGDHLLFDET